MVGSLGFNLAIIDEDGSKIRAGIVEQGIAVVESDHLEIPLYTDDQVVSFALEWQDLDGLDTKRARKLLMSEIDVGKVLSWVKQNYSLERLRVLYEFSLYCNWLDSKGVICHFGDLLRVFMTLQGERPSWCAVSYHLLLQVAYVELWKRYRTQSIREWLTLHWQEAVEHFENNRGLLDSLPKLQGMEYHHVYTQYKLLRKTVSR